MRASLPTTAERSDRCRDFVQNDILVTLFVKLNCYQVILALDTTRWLIQAHLSTLAASSGLNYKEDSMKLYYSPAACSLSPHIVAREAGIPIDLEKVNLADHKTETGQDYMTVNPKGYVPALRFDDGSVLTEGPAIIQYLADQKPASGLAPTAGTIERYRLQEWLTFIGTELHKSLGSLFNPATSDEAKETAKTGIAKRLAYLNDQLASKQYLMGSNFTVADAYAFTVVNWTNFLDIDLKAYPNLTAYMSRVGGRPKVQEALKAEGLVK
jgi:glutathione S-transferase